MYRPWQGLCPWRGSAAFRRPLKAGCEKAIPDNRDLVLSGGGILDLNHTAVTVASLAYGAGGGKVLNAENATLPQTAVLTISFDEILAGNPIVLTGDTDLSKLTLTVTGEVPALDPDVCHRYPIVKVVDGRASGTPTLTAPALPKGWIYRVNARGVQLVNPLGMAVIFR